MKGSLTILSKLEMKKSWKICIVLVCVLLSGDLIYNLKAEEKLPVNATIDKIVVLKSQRKLVAYANGQILQTYTIALGKNPVGAKQYEGDKKTPEGTYFINAKNPESKFHKNLGISYPNENDLKNAIQCGKASGGDIKIHGLQNGLGFIGRPHTLSDWTAGCIALTNQEIDDLYLHTPVGTLVEIEP